MVDASGGVNRAVPQPCQLPAGWAHYHAHTMQAECTPHTEATPAQPEHRRRLIHAMGGCAADRGYAATTIADIVREAGVSKRTFYEHFSSKEACFLALYRAVSAAALRTLSESVDPKRPWQDQLDSALRAYFAHLSAGPTLLRTLFVEVQHLGDEGAAARREVMQQLADFLLQTVNGRCGGAVTLPELAPPMAMAAVGGINELVLQAIEQGEAAQLEKLTPAASGIVRALALLPPAR